MEWEAHTPKLPDGWLNPQLELDIALPLSIMQPNICGGGGNREQRSERCVTGILALLT